MELGALGGHGLPVMHAWGDHFEAGCAAILPSLTEAGLVLGNTSRVALVETAPPCAQVKALGVRPGKVLCRSRKTLALTTMCFCLELFKGQPQATPVVLGEVSGRS